MSETRWAFMKRFTLVDEQGDVYLDRLRVVQTPWLSLYLHRLDVPDPGVDLHDHPWPFLSLILRGGYTEEVAETRWAPLYAGIAERYPSAERGVSRSWRTGTVHRMALTHCHRIVRLHRSPTWTLILTGRRRQSWGFYQPDGFVDHRQYDFAASGRRKLDVVQP